MERLTAKDFPPEVLKLFDSYVHGWMNRRDFIEKATKYTVVGGMSAATMLEALKPNYALAQQVQRNDARIVAEYLTYPSPQGSGRMRGYFVRPAKVVGKIPAVVVIHENRGLNPYVEDVTRRLATENFIAFAPDALYPVGGYSGSEAESAEAFAKLDPAKRLEDLAAAVPFVKTRTEFNGKFGAIGFCFGGGIVNLFSTRFPDMAAGVPYYGSQAPVADVAKIKSPLMFQYASTDERINAGIKTYEAALKTAGVNFQTHMYPNTQHGFHNDTTPRYDEAAAKLSWSRTLEFFNKHLRG